MAALIRFVGETDAEYQRRTRPVQALISSRLYGNAIRRLYENNNGLTQLLRLNELRRSCGVRSGETFKWTVYHDGKT